MIIWEDITNDVDSQLTDKEKILALEKQIQECEFKLLLLEDQKDRCDLVKSNNRIFKAIKNQLGEEYLQAVKDCLNDCEADRDLKLVKKPNIEEQKEDWDKFNHILVDQYLNGGMAGDSFAGYIYIPLKENLYLKSHYSL